jgi:hypothetical protein
METKRKTIFRLSELDELKRQMQEPLSPDELKRRQRLREQSDRFLAEMDPIEEDVKEWIRRERGDSAEE